MEGKFLFLDISTNLKLKSVPNGMKIQSLKIQLSFSQCGST